MKEDEIKQLVNKKRLELKRPLDLLELNEIIEFSNHIITKDFEEFEREHAKINVSLQIIRRILDDNNLTEDSKLIMQTMKALSHIYHKTLYPQNYKGDKQIA